MKQTHLKRTLLAVSAVTAAACATTGQAQSSDALLNKLVEKGIITKEEAKDLKTETDSGFSKAYQAKTGMPDWVTAFKINGDFRGRYEYFHSENDAFVDRSRWRYRLRLGMTAVLKDNFEVGVRLASGDVDNGIGAGLDPISQNQTLQNNASKKGIFIDMAYGKWGFLKTKDFTGSVTIGKMENPFTFSEMVYDPDYTPEGAGVNLAYKLNDHHTFKVNGGAFILDELGADSNDPYMFGGQVRWDGTWNQRITSSLGAAALNIVNEEALTTAAVPNSNRGNTRNAAGVLGVNLNPVIADASITYMFDEAPLYKGKFPVKLAGEYMNNLAVSDREEAWAAGVTFGKAGKKGTWEVSYRYKSLGGDAWYEEMVDSDFGAFYQSAPTGGSTGYGAGTNVRGHVVKASYSPYDSVVLSVTYFKTKLIDEVPSGSNSDMGRLQVDAIWKF
jgi:hypothetical protein